MYQTGLITVRSHAEPHRPSIQGVLEDSKFRKNWRIVADSARPEQIAELCTEGYNVVGSKKFKGSVVAGLDTMKRFPLCVWRGSNNLQVELQQYAWKKHATGTVLSEPEDKYNHAIDAARMWVMDELSGWQPAGRFHGAVSSKGKKKRRY